MNKLEAIESIKKISDGLLEVKFVSLESVIDIVSQIDEPQKVAIPNYVAEWIEKEKKKKQKRRLSHALGRVFNDSNELSLYIKQHEGDYTETIAKAWVYGYTVEKKKRYTVEIPNPDSDSLTVLEKFDDGTVVISQMDVFPFDWKNQAEYQLTEAEIRKDFEWAWQWAKEGIVTGKP